MQILHLAQTLRIPTKETKWFHGLQLGTVAMFWWLNGRKGGTKTDQMMQIHQIQSVQELCYSPQLMQVIVLRLHFVARHDKIKWLWLILGVLNEAWRWSYLWVKVISVLWDQYSLSGGHTPEVLPNHGRTPLRRWLVPSEDHCDWCTTVLCRGARTLAQAANDLLPLLKTISTEPNTQEMEEESRNIMEKDCCVDNGLLTFVHIYWIYASRMRCV